MMFALKYHLFLLSFFIDSDGNFFYVLLSFAFGLGFITQLIAHASLADHMTFIDQSRWCKKKKATL